MSDPSTPIPPPCTTAHAGPPTIAEIMTRRVVTVSMDDDIRRIRQIFDREKFHHVIVVESGRAVGIISDRDLLKHLSPFLGKITERVQDADTLHRRAHQVMSRPLIACAPQLPIAHAARLMLERRVSCMPVVDTDRRCVGIVTIRDVLAWALVRGDPAADRCDLPLAG